MTNTATARLDLPFIQSGQALKNITHNEALNRVDAGLYLYCSNMAADDLPIDPVEGHACIISGAPDTALIERIGQIGVYQSGVWLWYIPKAGWTVWDAAEKLLRVFDGASWVRPNSDTILDTLPHLGLNATASEQQRLAISSDTSLFTHDGGGHRLTVNRAAETDTASLIFQTDFVGQAELGLTGLDGFSLKTSFNGTDFTPKLTVSEAYAGIRSPAFGSERIRIENDAAVFLKTPATGGILVLTVVSDNGLPQVGHSGIFAYDTGTTPVLITLTKTRRVDNHQTNVLEGTHSASGNIGISAVNGGIYLENRLPLSRDISLTFLC